MVSTKNQKESTKSLLILVARKEELAKRKAEAERKERERVAAEERAKLAAEMELKAATNATAEAVCDRDSSFIIGENGTILPNPCIEDLFVLPSDPNATDATSSTTNSTSSSGIMVFSL